MSRNRSCVFSSNINSQETVPNLGSTVILTDMQDCDIASDGGSGKPSNLSPFAQPFLPRGPTSSLDIDNNNNNLPPSNVSVGPLPGLPTKDCKVGFQNAMHNIQRVLQGRNQESLNLELNQRCSPTLLTQCTEFEEDDNAFINSNCKSGLAGTSNSVERKLGEETRMKTKELDKHTSASWFSDGLPPPAVTVGKRAVGCERELKPQSQSQSSSSLSALNAQTNFNTNWEADIGAQYSMFGDSSCFWDPQPTSGDDNLKLFSLDSFFTVESFIPHTLTQSRLISRLSSLSSTEDNEVKSPTTFTSDTPRLANGEHTGLYRPTCPDKDKCGVKDDSDRKGASSQPGFPTMDENGNALDYLSGAAAAGNTPRGRTAPFGAETDFITMEEKDTGAFHVGYTTVRETLSSTDSGLGTSFSEVLCINLPEMETMASSDMNTAPGRGQGRTCPTHTERELSMHCADCCETICTVCFADQHMSCRQVRTTRQACHDLKWQLLKMQSAVGNHIQQLQHKVKELQPRANDIHARKQDAKDVLDHQLKDILQQVHTKHKQAMADLESDTINMEKQSKDSITKAEKTLFLLEHVSKLLEGLRQRDSGWELLSTFDRHLSHLLQRAVKTAQATVEALQPVDQHDLRVLSECEGMAHSVALGVLDEAGKLGGGESGTSSTLKPSSTSNEAYTQGVTKTDQGLSSGLFSLPVCDGNIFGDNCCSDPFSDIHIWHNKPADSTSDKTTGLDGWGKADERSFACFEFDEESLVKKICGYVQRITSDSNLCLSSRLPLFDDISQNRNQPASHFDLIDDVFPPSSIFTQAHAPAQASTYTLQKRLLPFFPQDTGKSFLTDMLLTDTGRLVFVDAKNNCLKCMDYQPKSLLAPSYLYVNNPLYMCTAGWERVMVSCQGRMLGVYTIGRHEIRQVLTRPTRHQYLGLARASDAMVAAACPESHSVDLLDLSGRVLKSLLPVDFVRGPEVIGTMPSGELLVVDQQAKPPSRLVCFDHGGTVQWTHNMPTADRHVSCCKVIGGHDGSVYYALQGDSVLYRFWPKTAKLCAVLTSHTGRQLQYPSSLAVDDEGRVLVTRNQLIAGSQPSLPDTEEIDIFSRQ